MMNDTNLTYFHISPSSRTTKAFIFKGKKYSIDFDLFVIYSDSFRRDIEKYQEKQEIEFPQEPVEVSDDAFQAFLNICQNKKVEKDKLTDSDILGIRQLAYHYEVHQLQNMINQIIKKEPTLLIQSSLYNLLTNIYPQQIRDDEKNIAEELVNIIDNEDLLKLPIQTLDHILNQYSFDVNNLDEANQNKVVEFLFKYLQKHKREASVLFLNLNLNKSNLEILERLDEEFSDIFDMSMISSKSLIKIIRDLNNTKISFSNTNSSMIQYTKNKLAAINKKIDDFLNLFQNKTGIIQKIDELKAKIYHFKEIYVNEKNRYKHEISQLNENINQMKNEIRNQSDFIQNQKAVENELKIEREQLNQIISDVTPQVFLNSKSNIIKFNSFTGEAQKLFISKMIDQKQFANFQLIQTISNLLAYLSNEQLKDKSTYNNKNYIYLHPKNVNDSIYTLKEIESIGISSYMTETLYRNGSLTSSDFLEHLNNFENAYIEIGYQEEQYERIHKEVIDIINSKYPNLKIGANIFEFRNYQYFQNDNQKLYSVRIDSRVGDKIQSGGKSQGRFENCKLLEILTFDNGIKYIEDGSFCHCENLKYIQFSESIEYIGKSAFFGCKNLTQILFPPNLSLVDENAFANCIKLNDIEINPYKANLKSSSFNNCCLLEQLTISSSITSTEKTEFENYERFSHIIIPNSIKTISNGSFKQFSFLKKVSLSSSVISIEDEAFCQCQKLEEITFSSSLTSIGKRSFYGCSSLKILYIPSSVKIIGEYAFSECNNLEQVLFGYPSSLTEISPSLFEKCNSMKKISIPSSVTSINLNSFKDCKSLIMIEIPSSVKSIGSSSFQNCSSLIQIIFQSLVNEIDISSFDGCKSLTQIICESKSSMNVIRQKALYKCCSLNQIAIPSLNAITENPYKFSNLIKKDIGMETQGILNELAKKSSSKFDRFFIASQSSDDLYDIINPFGSDKFGTNNNGHFFIEIELEKEIKINGFQIYSGSSNFPKSFDIEINGINKISIVSASELNGKNKVMKINVNQILCKKFRFIQTGPCWDANNDYLTIKRFELLSPESKYSNGVFHTLVSSRPDKDPHKCPVFISALTFDFNTFHLIDATRSICTDSNQNSWFQIELTRGFAILNGFRLKRNENWMLKSYKIICTDDANKPIKDWSILMEINEEKKDEHEICDIYKFSRPSPPAQFIRIIQVGPNWDNNNFLEFYHFDIFGVYF